MGDYNYHHSPQRVHAVRSAQKLASVFGATPRVVNDGFDSHGNDTASILSQGSTSSHRSTSSFSSKLGASLRRKAPPAPILLPMNGHRRHNSYPSPTSSHGSQTSPSSAEFEQPPPTATRRRAAQLAKLSRFLGENIPPEVLFGMPPTKYTPQPTIGGRRRGKSVSGPMESPPATVYAHTRTPTHSEFPSRRRPSADGPRMPTLPRSDTPFSNVQWDGESSTDESDASDLGHARSKSRAGRAEQDWEGAWNRMSMGEVRNKLRALK